MSFIARKKFLFLLLIVCFSLGIFQPAFAFESEHINNFVTMTFTDGGPVTIPINVRFSVWRFGTPEADEIDGSGNIVTSDPDYGGWQVVNTYTPAADGTVGIDLLNTTQFPTFPEIQNKSAYLQVEFKYPADPNTAYTIVDMLSDTPYAVKRFLLVDSLTSLNSIIVPAGTPNDTFTFDADFNSSQFIKLIFGQAAKSLTYDLLSNWFNMDSRLNLNGFAGVKLAINADASDSGTQLLSIRNSSGTPVYYVDETGGTTILGATVATTGSFTTLGASGLLTASNGLTLTTGALNMTATSGALTLSGLSASSISTGANALNFTASNFNTTSTGINNTAIGATTVSTGKFSTLTANTSLTLPAGSGTSAPILKHLSVTASSVASSNILAALCGTYATITVTGAAVGDTVIATPTAVSGGIETVNLTWVALVSAADTVIIRACNPLALTAINTADTQTWHVDVWGH